MKAIDVSIVVPTHNRAAAVCRAVRSIGRPAAAVEVLVVDDGSTDGTDAVLEREFGAAAEGELLNVVCLRQPNAGAAAARNLGLRHARGEFVKFLDSDDLLVEGALDRELAAARGSGADVVASGWRERVVPAGDTEACREWDVPPPRLENGIDDMLQGRSVWTAAALYRRGSIERLAWNPAHGKADDWGWVWTVCLSGARFVRLDIVSAVYCHYPGDRITRQGDPFRESTRVRQAILREVEAALGDTGRLTATRARALAAYYFKDRMVLAEHAPDEWSALCAHCRELAPGFMPEEPERLARPFVRALGPERGIKVFVGLRRAARGLGIRRVRTPAAGKRGG